MSDSAILATGLEEAKNTIDRFVTLLEQHQIKIKSGSQLQHGDEVIRKMSDTWKTLNDGGAMPDWPAFVEDVRVGMGTLSMMQLVLKRAAHADFPALLPHLRLMGDGDLAPTTKARVTDQNSNKLFELRLALACMEHGTGLQMDDPIRSSDGSNPDVLCTMPDRQKWGFACKVPHSNNPTTLFERFAEGVEQIERSSADVGFVVLSLKNLIPHEELIPRLDRRADGTPLYGAHPTKEQPLRLLKRAIIARVEGMKREVSEETVADHLRGKKAMPAVLVAVDEVVLLKEPGVAPWTLTYIHAQALQWGVAKRFDYFAQRIVKHINDGLVAL